MPRKPKQESPTGVYHWITRGINRQGIFHTSDDFAYFLDLVQEYSLALAGQVYHYCLMTNHVHLLIRVDSVKAMSDFSHFVKRRYAYYHSKVRKASGAAFERMYKSIPVSDDRYLLECARYIDRNPLRACLVKSVEEYSHTSYHFYAHGKNDRILTYSPAFLALSDDMTQRRELYIRYVNETRPQEEFADSRILRF